MSEALESGLPRRPGRRFSWNAAIRGPLLLAAIALGSWFLLDAARSEGWAAWRDEPVATGVATLALMAAATLYAVRRRTFSVSLFFLRPFSTRAVLRPLRPLMVQLDRMQTWRIAHLVIGSLWALGLLLHVEATAGGAVEQLLMVFCLLTLLSGLVGVLLQYAMPQALFGSIVREVRIADVDARRAAIFKRAEESVLGKSDALASAYIDNVRPILQGDSARSHMLEALLRGQDPGALVRGRLWFAFERLGEEDAPTYRDLVDLAEEKGRLDLNRFHLEMSTGWLVAHDALVAASWALVAVHLVGVAYY